MTYYCNYDLKNNPWRQDNSRNPEKQARKLVNIY